LKYNLNKIYLLTKNKNFIGFCLLVLISRAGFTFFFKIQNLILVDKGFNKDILANLSIIIIIVELVFNIIVHKPNNNFLSYAMKYYKYYLLSHVFSLLFIISFDFLISYELLTIITLIIITVFSNFLRSYFYLGFHGFYNKISDREIGGTYLTALNSINNLSMTLPGVIIYPAIDYFGYLFVGVVSLLYSLFFIWMFTDKVITYENIENEKWKAKLE